MENKLITRAALDPAAYALMIRRVGDHPASDKTERTITSSDLNRMTPRGRLISASRDEILAVLSASAKNTKPVPILEAAGVVRVNALA